MRARLGGDDGNGDMHHGHSAMEVMVVGIDGVYTSALEGKLCERRLCGYSFSTRAIIFFFFCCCCLMTFRGVLYHLVKFVHWRCWVVVLLLQIFHRRTAWILGDGLSFLLQITLDSVPDKKPS